MEQFSIHIKYRFRDLDKHVLCITTWSRFSDTGGFLLLLFLNTEPAISERQGLLSVPSHF